MQEQRWNKQGTIFPCIQEDVWDQDPSAPFILKVGDKLRMYYHGRNSGCLRVGLAEADPQDPLNWKKVSDEPVFDLGPQGTIDSHWVSYPWVVPITDSHWHMYYAAWGGEFHEDNPNRKIWRTTFAESDDGGMTWTRSGTPLLDLGRPYACDEHGTGSCCVLPVGDEYWMWYTALYNPVDWYRISVALAVSRDGGHTFKPHPAGALVNLTPALGSPGSTSSKPFVEKTDQGFRMWYSCAKDGLHYRIHYGESVDGIHFSCWPDPVLDVSPSGWDQALTCYPAILCLAGKTYMFYSGDRCAGIGVAELAHS